MTLKIKVFLRKKIVMSDIKIFRKISDYQKFRKEIDSSLKIGFVPTMGALHSGHAELLKKSVSENDITILSIYVNPTQFNDPNDFNKYPVTWESDVKLATECAITAIFAPNYEEMYPDKYHYKIIENNFSTKLCGAHRPGHFDGVLTIVMKLFNVVRPHKAYFGEKDFQQLTLIKGMVDTFFLSIKIVPVSTVREESGLAKSSRNTRLTFEGKTKASEIYKIIKSAKTSDDAKEKLTSLGFQVDYVEDFNQRRYVAAFVEGVRLIDNVAI